MRIHIVVPYLSVAMRRMYEPLVKELQALYEVTTSDTPDDEADLNYHIPFHTLIGYETKGKHAMAYTHCNVGQEAQLLDACERADLITCMTFTGKKELVSMGVDPAKIWVIYSAADQHYFKKRMIGVIGYPQPNGRKRESILLDLAWKSNLDAFQFAFIGAGWEDTVTKLQSLGVAASAIHADSDDVLRSFYHQLDVLLVTGYREGGSLPILEAMATGIKVFSPCFGYASDLLDEDCYYDTVEDLAKLLDDYAEPFITRHKLARAWRWKDYCAEHALIFGRLLGESVDLYPENGMSRYNQLIDVIHEVEPRSIVEIGTWNGNRAIQMLQVANVYHPIEEIDYQGFDLFESQTGEQFRRELSKQGWDKHVVEKRILATGANVNLVAGNTKETLVYINNADFYFIDGGHSEATIENDADYVLETMPYSATVVFDDYYHENKPKGMGCNKYIDSLDRNIYEVTHLPVKTVTDTKTIGMVKVRKHGKLPLQMQTETLAGSIALHDGNTDYSLPSLQRNDAQSSAGC